MLLFLLALGKKFATVQEEVFNSISGEWTGKVVYSPTDSMSQNILSDYTLNFVTDPSNTFTTATITNSSSKESKVLYLKADKDEKDILVIADKENEDITKIRIIPDPKEKFRYVIRGILPPKNDQITVSLEETYLTISITDQFTSNVTMMQFKQETSPVQSSTIVTFGLFITAIVCISVALYKASDLVDVIKPEEAAVAAVTKAMSKQADEKKKQQSAQSTPSKAKNE